MLDNLISAACEAGPGSLEWLILADRLEELDGPVHTIDVTVG